MILSKQVEIILGSKNYTFIKRKYNLDDSLSPGDIAIIPISLLSKGSHSEIDITCDYCESKLKVPYKRYNLNTKVVNKYACSKKECSNQKIKDVCNKKYGVDNPFQLENFKQKSKNTLLEKYGVDHPMQLQEIKDKVKETCIDRYGVEYVTQSSSMKEKSRQTSIKNYGVDHPTKSESQQEKRKITRIKKGSQMPDEMVSEYRKYRNRVVTLTSKIKSEVLDKWDGYDYYDGEYIRDNFNLSIHDRNYPQFDHKISIAYGLLNNISPEEISKIDNICITKQHINSTKKEKCEKDFIKSL